MTEYNKKEIKEVLKRFGYTVIAKSWYTSDKAHMFNAYDEDGVCSYFYIDNQYRYARRTTLSCIILHEQHNINDWFWK